MIRFDLLKYLDKHHALLNNLLGDEVFFVGGSVRDVLLGITHNPTDIDLTGNFHPDVVYEHLEPHREELAGLFRTEKYGTITLLQKDEGSDDTYSYEITPFRKEGGYEDKRHPDEVEWTSSLILDSARRDFTINTLYYTSFDIKDYPTSPVGDIPHEDQTKMLAKLTKQGWAYLPKLQLWILQDTNLITQFFPEGKLDRKAVDTFIQTYAIPCTPSKGMRFLLDPVVGLEDLVTCRLTTVGNPDDRFSEDALRILRALRFVNILNQKVEKGRFDFFKETRQSIQKNHALVEHIAKERIHDELVKVFSGSNPFGYIALLDQSGLLPYIFPALHHCKHNDQPVRYHPFDTYAHTLLTLLHVQKLNGDYLVKLGMLYHDVGKPDQYEAYAKCTTKEEIAALHASPSNHIICGPVYAERDFEALGFSRKEIETISRYVAMHMRPGQILEAAEDNQLKKVRLLYSKYGYDLTKNLFDICVADRLGQYNPVQSGEVDAVNILYRHLDLLRDTEGQFTKSAMAVDGNDIMKEYDLPAGPMVGEFLEKAYQRVIQEIAVRNKKDTILHYLKSLVVNAQKEKKKTEAKK